MLAPAGESVSIGERFTLDVPLSAEDSLVGLEVWIDGRRGFRIEEDELSSFAGDGRSVQVPFVTASPISDISVVDGIAHQSATLSEDGDFQLFLQPGKTSLVTFVVRIRSNGKELCGAPVKAFAMGDIDIFAIVIGFNYSVPDYQLQYAARDAAAMTQHLVDALGAKEQNIWLFSDDVSLQSKFPKVRFLTPTKPIDIRKAYEEITRKADRKSRVYLYFSGHMVRPEAVNDSSVDSSVGPLFLLPNSNLYERETMLLRDDVSNLINKSGFSVAVILDACFSGDTKLIAEYPSAEPTVNRGIKRARRQKYRGTAYQGIMNTGARITSSNGLEPSWELDQFQHGVFTYFLLDAASGKADLKLVDAYEHALKSMQTLQPVDWPKPLKQTPTEFWGDGARDIPWKTKR